jgi:hypothetical protein
MTDFQVPDFIGEYKIPDEICDGLIELFKDNRSLQQPGRVMNRDKGSIIDRDTKESMDLQFPPLHPDPRFKAYMFELGKILYRYREEVMRVKMPMAVADSVNIQWYPPGGGFKKYHAERTSYENRSRVLTFMTYLNTVTDEGGTEFPNQGKIFYPIKGNTLIWSSEWMHVHRGIPSPTQEKMIITGWTDMIPSNEGIEW